MFEFFSFGRVFCLVLFGIFFFNWAERICSMLFLPWICFHVLNPRDSERYSLILCEETVWVEKATHLQHTLDLCCSVGKDGMLYSCIMDVWMHPTTSLGFPNIFKHGDNQQCLKRANKQIKKTPEPNKQPRKREREKICLLKLKWILQINYILIKWEIFIINTFS